jgi:hypothetical protein
MLEEVVDRPNLGQKRPHRSKDHHNNLHDRTRTVAWGKTMDKDIDNIARIVQG